MSRGKIELYGQDDTMVAHYKYNCVKARKEIIEKWKGLYAEAFNKCYFIIIPIVDISMVKLNGENYGLKELYEYKRQSRKLEKPKKSVPYGR
jgi:hypothetical protein